MVCDDYQAWVGLELDTSKVVVSSMRIPIKELEMPKSKSHGGSKYSFRNPPASAIEPKFGSGSAGMKRAPNAPVKSMKSSAKKKN